MAGTTEPVHEPRNLERPALRSRLLSLLLVVGAIGAPAAVLRALCVGHSCDKTADVSSQVPFCSLPGEVRRRVAAGFREGRSPEILAVTGSTSVTSRASPTGAPAVTWPSASSEKLTATEVPIVFAGDGVTPGAPVPDGAGLDDIAPTVAEIIALQRAHPEVRSGTPIEGVASGKPPHLVLEVVLKGLGSKELSAHPRAWPTLKSLMEHGAATMSGEVGSLPLDPAASLTTIGTGGMPSQHGITGSMIRNDQGQLVIAWGRGSPVNVIATLGDDLDQKFHQEPEIGMVGSDQSDRGLIGGSWYVDIDRDLFIKSSKNPAQAAAGMLKDGFGKDDVPDLLGVALEGSLLQMDEALKTVLRAARRASQGSFAVVVTATGSLRQASGSTVQPKEVVRGIELAVGAKRRIVEAVGAGGLFLDQKTVAKASISDDEVLKPLLAMKAPNGQPLVADAFPAIAVSFARYC